MPQRDYTPYQQKVIQRYYDNRDQIEDQRLAELVTSLYLETSEKKKAKMWERAAELMVRMELPQSRIDHVMESKDAALLGKVVEELQNGRLRRGAGAKKDSQKKADR